MPTQVYDVRDRSWLPVRIGGVAARIGLKELFTRAQEITDLEIGLPPAAAGLWRLLEVIASRITGLDATDDGVDAWFDHREQILSQRTFDSDAVAEYFAKFGDRFDLFDAARPWLQDPRLAGQCAKATGLNKLVLGRPAGNNQPWVSHHHDRAVVPIGVEEAIQYLIAQLYYGPSGRCTARTVNGTTEANTLAGPLRSVVSFHLVGANVFESLVAGIPFLPRDPGGCDAAPWEWVELPDPLGLPKPPTGVGGVLAGRFHHALLLTPSPDCRHVVDSRITWALRQPYPQVADPYLIYQKNKAGEPYARPASADRALWRDLDALLGEDVGIEHRHRPAVLDMAQWLPHELLERLRVRAYGFDQDGQTRNKQWHIAVTPPVLSLIRDESAVAGVSRVREAAEHAQRRLHTALRNAWVAINDPSNGDGRPARKDIPAGPWPALADARYWPQAEARYWRRVRARDFDSPEREFVLLATAAFDQVTGPATARPRAARAVEHARGFIFQALNTAKGT